MKSSEVRAAFIDFFANKGHTVVPGSPVVLKDDPTLLFVNAGMNQFKDVFLGQGKRPYRRATNSQVCIRVSGKHNDLEEVGRDTHHQTLFEMLGNWSFGDYYKKEAISWAWAILTEVYGLPKARLYATVYDTDDDAFSLWASETDIDPTHIVRCGKYDNFWEMGDEGPCGPCSEIHIDLSETPSPTVEMNPSTGGLSDRYMELWNLVFIQYNQLSDGTLEDLPEKHVDTGAGLERIVAYLQGTQSNYDTDLFQPIIERIVSLSGVPYVSGEKGMPHRVLADHIRTLSFAIADNVLPSNEGRGYVLRRLLRRASNYAQKLQQKEPFLYQLLDPLIAVMGDHYHHLNEQKELITGIIKQEEAQFLRTLGSGKQVFSQLITTLKSEGKQTIEGQDAFKLYDTYGFPLDLTALLAAEHGVQVDNDGFLVAMDAQKAASRKASKVHQAVYGGDVPKGGEARIVTTTEDITKMARHHTGTHLLHAALRQVLGDHVQQAGSLVDIDHLRFDFTHPKPLTPKEIDQVSTIVTQKVTEDLLVEAFEKPIDEAKKMGALAFFGEKYGDIVRVIKISDFSTELCGGHHVPQTGVVEQFKLVSETGIAAGVRRVVALAGTDVIRAYENSKRDEVNDAIEKKLRLREQLFQECLSLDSDVAPLKELGFSQEQALTVANEVFSRTIEDIKRLEKVFQRLKQELAGKQRLALKEKIETLPNDIFLLTEVFDAYDIHMLKTLSDTFMSETKRRIIIFASQHDNKGYLLVKLSPELISETLSAPLLLAKLTDVAGGRGGGNPKMAQAGGADPKRLREAIAAVKTYLQETSFS